MTLTVPEAARRTGKNPETIRRWIREGKLRAMKVGTQHMIEAADLDAMTGQGSHRVGEGPAVYTSAVRRIPWWDAVPNEWLPALVGRLVRAVDPVRIVVHGDRAQGAAAPDASYDLVVVLDDVPDRDEATIAVHRAIEDIPVVTKIQVTSAGEAAATRTVPSRRGLTVYSRDRVSIMERLIETGRATPPLNPDTSVLPRRWPATTGITASEALLAERREDPR